MYATLSVLVCISVRDDFVLLVIRRIYNQYKYNCMQLSVQEKRYAIVICFVLETIVQCLFLLNKAKSNKSLIQLYLAHSWKKHIWKVIGFHYFIAKLSPSSSFSWAVLVLFSTDPSSRPTSQPARIVLFSKNSTDLWK